MRAAVLREFHAPVVLEDVHVDAPRSDEVLIRTAASGVCHTDRTMQLGAQPLTLPLVLGHEVAGVVEAVGSGVTYVRPGDRVVINASASCGSCEWCMRGELQHCESKGRARYVGEPPRISIGGVPVQAFVGIGGFAEQVLVHERAVVRVPDAMPLDLASLLGCAVLTGYGAVVHAARVRPGQTVAVIGCGGVGLNVVQAARLAGASRVIAVDRIREKLDAATTFGATDVVDASSVDAVGAVQALVGEGVDHALEIVGRPETIEQAFAMLRTRGTATVVGVARPEHRISLPATDFLVEKRIQGTKMGSARPRLDIPLLCQLYLDGRLMLDELVSHRVGLDGVDAALADLDAPHGARTIAVFDV